MATTDVISLLSLWIIKPLIIIAVVLAGSLLLQRKSAALQHFWLSLGLLAVLLSPLLAVIVPRLEWEILPFEAEGDDLAWFQDVLGSVTYSHYWMILAFYLFFASSLFCYFLLGIGQLQWQSHGARSCDDQEFQQWLAELCQEFDIKRKVSLRQSENLVTPFTWGVIHPVIMLPMTADTWSSERKFAVLVHELAHIARNDWATLFLARLGQALFWFLPPVWWLVGRLETCAEMAADDYIYRLHEKHLAYAENLLAFARGEVLVKNARPVVSMAGRSPMYARIRAVLDQRRPHQAVTSETTQYWVLISLFLLVPLVAVQVMPIQRTLVARLVVLQLPLAGSQSTEYLNESDSSVESDNLQVIKQQLVPLDLPKLRRQDLHVPGFDHVVVTFDASSLADSGDAEPEKFQLPELSGGVIQVEGYMPVRTIMPVYPRWALQQRIEGEIIVRFTIAVDGRVTDPEIVSAQPPQVFERAVLHALKGWSYQPLMLNGGPVSLLGVTEKFTFQLQSDQSLRRR